MNTARTLPFGDLEFQGHKILVVDDAMENRIIIKFYLRSLGFETSEASNGEEALKKVSEEHFDLIFMDLQMPLMDGYEATRNILALDNPPPVVAITASYLAETRNICRDIGFKECLSKPMDQSKLVSSARQFIRRHEVEPPRGLES